MRYPRAPACRDATGPFDLEEDRLGSGGEIQRAVPTVARNDPTETLPAPPRTGGGRRDRPGGAAPGGPSFSAGRRGNRCTPGTIDAGSLPIPVARTGRALPRFVSRRRQWLRGHSVSDGGSKGHGATGGTAATSRRPRTSPTDPAWGYCAGQTIPESQRGLRAHSRRGGLPSADARRAPARPGHLPTPRRPTSVSRIPWSTARRPGRRRTSRSKLRSAPRAPPSPGRAHPPSG